MKPLLPVALAALLAFVAGLVLSPLLHSGRPSSNHEEATSSSHPGDASQTGLAPGGRALPLARTDRVPKNTAELISDFQDAANEPNLFRRIGRMWWLSERLTPQNAREVAQAALKSAHGSEREFLVGGIFVGWARVDPKGTIDYAQSLPEDERREAMMGAIMGWAGDDPDAATAWMEKLPPGEQKRNAQQMIINSLAESDPDRALEMVMGKSWASNDRSSYAFSIFSSLAKRDPSGAAERAASLPQGRFRNNALRVVADNWSQQDRAAALKWVDELPEGPAKQQTVSGVVQNWVQTDFDGALAWLQKRPEGSSRSRLIQDLAYSVTNDNPENAIRLVDLVNSSSGQDRMLETIARAWSRNDSAAAQQWAQSQTDGAVKKAVWEGIVSSMSSESPPQAVALLPQLPPGQQDDAVQDIARNWANQDPAAAAKWSSTLAGDTRTQALGSIMSNWVRDDPSTALKWFSTTPAGKERDSVISRFVSDLADDNPTLAIQWTQSISDPKQRLNRLENLAENWMRNDSASASAWIANSDLSSETKKRLLSSPK